MKRKIAASFAVILVGILLASYQNCSDSVGVKSGLGDISKQTEEASQLDAGERNQAPLVTCSIYDSTGNSLRTVSTLPQSESFTGQIKENQSLKIDCSGSHNNQSSVSNLKFYISKSLNGVDNFTPMTGSDTSYIFENSDDYVVKIKAVDEMGLVTIKTFSVIVQCSDSVPELKVDVNKVKINMGQLGFFDYNAEGAVSGGKPPFVYSWDFNGDGTFDLYDLLVPQVWSSKTLATHVYTNFSGIRMVGLRVKDSCNKLVGPVYMATNFDEKGFSGSKMAITAPLALEKSFYYLQANIRPKGDISSDTAKTSTVDFFGTQLPGLDSGSTLKRVICSYNEKAYIVGKSSFQIDALNFYDKGMPQPENPNLIHGMKLIIDDIPDTGIQGLQNFSSSDMSNPIKLSQLDYFVSENEDGTTKNKYSLSEKCVVAFHIKRADGQIPCANDPRRVMASTKAIIMTGEFSCPSLSSTKAGLKPLKAEHGYFFCEVKTLDQCVGGGGGGSGGVPPIPE